MLRVLHLRRIKRTPRGVVGVVHQRGTKAYLQIPIIPPRVRDENCCMHECVYVCVYATLPMNLFG